MSELPIQAQGPIQKALGGPLRGPRGPHHGYGRPFMAPVGPYMTTEVNNLYTMEIRVYKHIVE